MQSQKTADVYGGINTPSAGQNTPSKFFKPISILMTSFALAVSGLACGGDDLPELEFIAVPGGEFTLTHDTTAHKSGETLTMNAFSMGKTPVTVAQFKKCAKAGKCSVFYLEADEDLDLLCNYNRGKAWENHPMNCIGHGSASSFCAWIGGRLPTAEEWEYAATHNGQKHLNTKYPWGDTPPVHCQTANYPIYDEESDTKTFCNGKSEAPEGSELGTSEVGTYSPAGDSPLGFVDMMGNVREWTDSRDSYFSDSYATKGISWYEEDPVTYSSQGDTCITDFILSNGSSVFFDDLGFRCVK